MAYSDQEKDSLTKKLCKEPFVLIRPDDLEGINNDIHWGLAKSENLHLIINILLAPPFAFASKVSILAYYDKNDVFVLANQAIMPAFAGMEGSDLFVESPLGSSIWDFVDYGMNNTRTSIAVYIGKGILRPFPSTLRPLGIREREINSQSLILIKRSWPTSKEHLYSILASSKILISYDPFSHIERVATTLGTPVLKMTNYNLRELPGVFTMSDFSASAPGLLAGPEETHLQSMKNYEDSLLASKNNLLRIVSSILATAYVSPYNEHLKDVFTPYSKHCLLAFSSQLRGLLPYMGTLSMAHLNEDLDVSELLELTDPSASLGSMSLAANNYMNKAKAFAIKSNFPNSTGIGRVYYQYKKQISADWSHDAGSKF